MKQKNFGLACLLPLPPANAAHNKDHTHNYKHEEYFMHAHLFPCCIKTPKLFRGNINPHQDVKIDNFFSLGSNVQKLYSILTA